LLLNSLCVIPLQLTFENFDADGVTRLLMFRHALRHVARNMAEEIGVDLPLLLSIASQTPLYPPPPPTSIHADTTSLDFLSVEQLLQQDEHVLLHIFDANSMHVHHQLPAVLYLAFRYGHTAEHAHTALAISSSLPGQAALRTAMLGILFGLAFGEVCLPGTVKEALDQQVHMHTHVQYIYIYIST